MQSSTRFAHFRAARKLICVRQHELAQQTPHVETARGKIAAQRVEHFRRDADGSFRYRVYGPGDLIALANGANVSVDAVYENAFDLEAG